MATISKLFKCPCCGKETLLGERNWEVCSNCGWEDDAIQFENPDFAGGANFFSLNEYRKLYLDGKDVQKLEAEKNRPSQINDL